jgi:hypothetical protein
MIKTGYKRTGVLTVDKVAACIYHHERQGRPLSKVILDRQHWKIFRAYAEQIAPDCVQCDNWIDFDGVTIQEGSSLMTKDMYWEFKKHEQV